MWSAEHTALQKCLIVTVVTWKAEMNRLCVCSLNLLQVGKVASPLTTGKEVESGTEGGER